MNSRLESLWKIYETTGEWVRFSDTKASAILATEGVIASIVLPQLSNINGIIQQNVVLLLLVIVSISSGLIAFYYSVRALMPKIGVQDIISVIFFAQIARRYPRPSDYEHTVRQLFIDEDQIEAQVAQEVWSLSYIATRKYALVNRATVSFTISVFSGVVAALMGILL